MIVYWEFRRYVTPYSVAKLTTCLLTFEGVRKGQLNSYVANNVWWCRDQYFSVAENKSVIKEILEKGLADRVLAEKSEATYIWKQIEALSNQLDLKNADDLQAIRVSCTYGRIKYQLIEQIWILMIAKAEKHAARKLDVMVVKNAIKRYDDLWREWHQLEQSSKYCATLYTDKAFRNIDTGGIGAFVNDLRKEVN